ncbi:MerR family transcriptional regulator [Kineosporia sp. A_224]|uniref:DNA polymerase III subunit beta family protein n=1 Tax=Kineosporia sp. A_224 TaxID=1962180 RepID=UPI0018EA18C7|nr:MerR family transcriptional regulator [Kineosporia sp. A_224]
MESTYGIGEMARATGLSVGALRFYDREGLLAPAHVDPWSGYRRYADEQVAVGRLVARLRRVGLPLADVGRVLAHPHDRAVVGAVLGAHLHRLETGLDLARRELSAVLEQLRDDLDDQETPMTSQTSPNDLTLTLPAADLATALRGVRFAAGTDPALPAITGVLLDVAGATLRVVATDRYRLAVTTVPVVRPDGAQAGPADGSALVPAAFADAVVAACPAGAADAHVLLGPDVAVTVAGRTLTTAVLGAPYPQWERLVRPGRTTVVTLDATAVRDGARAARTTTRRRDDGATFETCAFQVSGDGLVWLAPDDAAHGVAVNREFLIEAVEALDGDQLVLGVDDAHTPLALTSPGRPGALSILMPVRHDG